MCSFGGGFFNGDDCRFDGSFLIGRPIFDFVGNSQWGSQIVASG